MRLTIVAAAGATSPGLRRVYGGPDVATSGGPKVNWGQVSQAVRNCQNEFSGSKPRRLYGSDASWEERMKSELQLCTTCVRSKFSPDADFYQGNLEDYVKSRLNVGWGTVQQSLRTCQKSAEMLKMAGRAPRRLEAAEYTTGDAAYDEAMVECVHAQHRPWSQYAQGSMPKYLEKLQTTNWGEVSRKYEECKFFDKSGSRQLYGGVEAAPAQTTVEKYMAGLESCVLGKLPYSVKMPQSEGKYLSLGAYLEKKLDTNWGTVANKLNECQAAAAGKARPTYESADQFKAAQQAQVEEMTACVKSKLPTAATYSQGNVGEYIYSRMRVGWGTWQQNQQACIQGTQMQAMEARRLYATVDNKEATSATEAYDKALFACILGKDKYGSQYFQGDAWNYMQSKMKTNWGEVQRKFADCNTGARRLNAASARASARASEAQYVKSMKDCVVGKLPFSTKFPTDNDRYTSVETYLKTLMTSGSRDVEPQLNGCLNQAAAAQGAPRQLSWAEKREKRKASSSGRTSALKDKKDSRTEQRQQAAQKRKEKRAKDTEARTRMEQAVSDTADCVVASHPPGWSFSFDVKDHVKSRMVKNWGQVTEAIKACKGETGSRQLYATDDVVNKIAECVANKFEGFAMYYGDLTMYIDSQRRRYNY